MTSFAKALLDPTAVFHSPDDVLQRHDLSREQKIEILRRWEYDARALQVAEDESMLASQPQPPLEQVLLALRKLGVEFDPQSSAPTKHGGRRIIGPEDSP
jgi:hypothetical protein